MSTVKTIAKNTAYIFSSQILLYIFGFFTLIYTARYLGAGGFGILSLALSITGIFAMFIDMGLNTFMVREIARDKSIVDKYIPNVALMRIILSFLTIGLIILIVNIINYPEIVKIVIYIITTSVIINAFSGIFSSIFQANEKMEYLSISMLIPSVSLLLGTLIGVYYKFTIIYFAYLYIISSCLVLGFITITYLCNFKFPKIKIDWSIWKPTLKEAWPFGVAAISGLLYTYIDSILLSIIEGNTVVGWYSAAYRLMLVVLFIPTTVNTVIFPVMSQLFKSSGDSLRMINERYFKYMIIIGIPMGFGTTILADKIILLIYGASYSNSILSLQILIWTMVFTFIGASFVQVLQSINKQLIITKIAGICVIINIVLNLILIPKFSFIGASIATVITEIILVGYTTLATYKLGYGINNIEMERDLIKVLGATVIMSIFILYFKSLNLFLLIFIAIFLYLGVLYILRIFDDTDSYIIKEIFNITKS
jgi:O-antigen/teichoic acid export membrane protein